jgi:hypothetical protein
MPYANHPTRQHDSPWNTADAHRLQLCTEFQAQDTSFSCVKKVLVVTCCAAFTLGWRLSGKLSGGLFFVVALLVALGLVTLAAGRWRDVLYLMSGLRRVDAMTGNDFETYVAAKSESPAIE